MRYLWKGLSGDRFLDDMHTNHVINAYKKTLLRLTLIRNLTSRLDLQEQDLLQAAQDFICDLEYEKRILGHELIKRGIRPKEVVKSENPKGV